MPKISEHSRQQRKERILMLLRQYDGGLTEREIAEHLKLERRTTHNYLKELDAEAKLEKDGHVWCIAPFQPAVLRPFELTPEQAMVLYLASRLYVKHSDQRNETAETVLLHLADILSGDMGLDDDIRQAAQELAQRPFRPDYEDVFRTMMRAYIYRRRVDITYHPYRGQPFTTAFAPYLIEPSAIGFATYAIGHSSIVDDLRTYKLERIEHATLRLHDTYTVPASFPGLQVLRNAWSIYYGEQVVTVRLRFAPEVAKRVQESQWHPSQVLSWDEDQPGHLLVTLEVADTTDLLPWIRTWGANCEVLEPPGLRRQMIKGVRRLAGIYELAPPQPASPLSALWAKTDRQTGDIHLLIYHLIDVAQVTLVLWHEALSKSFRDQICAWLDLDVDQAGRLLAFWAGLHDMGKASPAFQSKFSPAEASLAAVGLAIPNTAIPNVPHGTVSAYVLQDALTVQVGRRWANRIARALGGHHGAWPVPSELQRRADFGPASLGDESWTHARGLVYTALEDVIAPPASVTIDLTQTDANTLLVLLSGLTSVADWLGSMSESFPFESDLIDLSSYAQQTADQARHALERLGWLGWQGTGQTATFEQLFPTLPGPNPVQDVVMQHASTCRSPSLVILEAPTGIGKTEAALAVADRWLQEQLGRGLYVAMPTQATSNQMFGRVKAFLEHRYPADLVNLHLLHGQARWNPEAEAIQLAEIADHETQTIAAMQWFLPRKRSLLAPFAVGTVDQALMSILLARHFFVRMIGLGHKVVIFDEVHAYDTYMAVLFQRLLAWLRELNTSVIILSATLPNDTRRELIASYTQSEEASALSHHDDYPLLTVCDEAEVRAVPLPPPRSREIGMRWISRNPAAIVAVLKNVLRDGGCAVVICNTVRRAQDVYLALAHTDLVAPSDLLLFHARFPPIWRQDIERAVLDRFGKSGTRPTRSILVATQVVEQSLDLDFDVMITDLAPVDLIIQRVGRLHRHQRNHRPSPVAYPQLYITSPAHDSPSGTDWGADAFVYDRYTLWATQLALETDDSLILPDDTRTLIEAVYGERDWWDDLPNALSAGLREAHAEMVDARRLDEHEAMQRIVRLPGDERLLSQPNPGLEEDDPDTHRMLQAMTRLIEPGVEVVCLHHTAAGICLEPDGTRLIDPFATLTPDLERQCLLRAVSIRHPVVRQALLTAEPPLAWQRSAVLRHHRLAVFSDGMFAVPQTPYRLRLTRTLGLEIIKHNDPIV